MNKATTTTMEEAISRATATTIEGMKKAMQEAFGNMASREQYENLLSQTIGEFECRFISNLILSYATFDSLVDKLEAHMLGREDAGMLALSNPIAVGVPIEVVPIEAIGGNDAEGEVTEVVEIDGFGGKGEGRQRVEQGNR
ncbi:hypothetical protein Scep_007635 [Stephania cephalantha]|uniref:Uncharacterized protein n=1 Tax=Stephania cephalantha TaxID=152367 RepID=A0AAP0KC25_9MAGN